MYNKLRLSLSIECSNCIFLFFRIQSNNLFVRGGIWNSNDELFQIRKISEIILHPDYNSEHPRNDIALLVLEQPFEITDNVNTICLPITNDRWDTNNCFVAGWGAGEMIGESETNF